MYDLEVRRRKHPVVGSLGKHTRPSKVLAKNEESRMDGGKGKVR